MLRESCFVRGRAPHRLLTAAAVVLAILGIASGASSEPIQIETSAAEASVSLNKVAGASGAIAYATVLATRRASGEATLYVRICQDLSSECDFYTHALTPIEYVIQPDNSVASIMAQVNSLGLVDVYLGAMSYNSGGQIAPGAPQERSIVYMQGLQQLGGSAARALGRFGDLIGPWVSLASSGINAHNVSVVWIRP